MSSCGFISFSFPVLAKFMTTSFASDVQTNLMRKVVRDGRPPRPAQAPDFEEGKEDYIDYMYDETITTEPLVAPLPIQKKRPVVNTNRILPIQKKRPVVNTNRLLPIQKKRPVVNTNRLKERMRKQGSHSTQDGAQVIPMVTYKKGKQMFARYKLELPVEVPLRSAGSRTRVAKTQTTRHNIRRKTSSEGNPASDVILRYGGVGDGEVAKVLEEQQSQLQLGSGADIGEQIRRHEQTEYEKEAAKARKTQEDYEKQVEKYKKDLEEYYTKYPQTRPADYTGPLIAAPVTKEDDSKEEQKETVAELNKHAPDKDVRYEEISEDQLGRMGMNTQEMRPAQHDPAAMPMTSGMSMAASQPQMMSVMGGSGGMSSGLGMGMNGMSMNGMGTSGMNGIGMNGMSSGMMSQPGMMMSPGMMSMDGGGMNPGMGMTMMPDQMTMNGGGMGMQSAMMPGMSATSPQVSFMQGRK